MKKVIFATLAVVLFSGCATTGTDIEGSVSVYEEYIKSKQLEEVAKITSFSFHDWRGLDDKHLIISTSFSKPYLITLKRTCRDLSSAHAIGINNKGSTLSAGFDAIYTLKPPKEMCFIKSIHKLTREQADEIAGLR